LNNKRSSPDLSPVAFGRYIQVIREQKGIDLKTVSEALKVSVDKLALIEAEDYDQLPEGIYIKGILRSYARYIGIDADDLIDRYEINRAASSPGIQTEEKRGRQEKKMLLRMFFSLLLLAGIGGVSIGLFYQLDLFRNPGSGTEPAVLPREPAGPKAVPGNNGPGKQVLVIDAIEKTWIKINIDGEEPLEYLLRPRDHVELEADSRFHLLIGNAGGLEMRLNGEPVEIDGKSGEVLTLELPRTPRE